MPLPLRQRLRLWASLQRLYVSWSIYPSTVPALTCWQGFCFLSVVVFSEVHRFIAPPQPHSQMCTQIPPFSSIDYVTWQFFCSRLPVPYFCSEWCNWVSLSIIHVNLGGLPFPGTQPQIWLIMSLGLQCPGTHQLYSSKVRVCCLLLPYLATVRMHINLPYFLVLWLHLHLLVILLCILFCSPFPTRMCPPSCLPP